MVFILKSNIPDFYSHKYWRKSNSNSDEDDLLLEKTLNMENSVTTIKSTFKKNQSNYYYHMVLGIYSYK